VKRGFTARLAELLAVTWHQWAGCVKEKILCLGVVRQGVQLATQWFVMSERTTGRPQKLASAFKAQAPHALGFRLAQRDFQWRIAFIDATTRLTLSAMIKKHNLSGAGPAEYFTLRCDDRQLWPVTHSNHVAWPVMWDFEQIRMNFTNILILWIYLDSV
jgi:hypothetical protein